MKLGLNFKVMKRFMRISELILSQGNKNEVKTLSLTRTNIWELMMEHRYYPRLQMSVKIGVFKQNEFLGYFNTRDISLDGLYFKMMPVMVNPNDVVSLLLSINGDTHLQKGLVVHVSDAGAGIMMIDSDKQVIRAIFSLFDEHKMPINHALDGHDRPLPPASRLPMLLGEQDLTKRRMKAPQGTQGELSYTPHKGLLIKIGTHLDISSARLFNQLIKNIRSLSPKILVIDLTATQHLFDSGLALLLLLQQEAVELENRIYLINGNSKIVDKLSASSVTTKLHIL